MKKIFTRVSLLLLVLFTASCGSEQKHIEVATIKVAQNGHLNGDEKAPAAAIDLTFSYIKDAKANGPEQKINGELLAEIIGDHDEGIEKDFKKVLDEYATSYITWYKDSVEELYNQEKAAGEVAEASFMYEQKNEVTLEMQTASLLAFKATNYIFTGGAHGMYSTHILNFDKATGERLVLADIFKPESEDLLIEVIYKAFKKEFFPDAEVGEEAGFFNLEESLGPSENFLFTADGITFIYPLYEIAPYVMGEPTATVPYSELKELLDYENPIVKELAK